MCVLIGVTKTLIIRQRHRYTQKPINFIFQTFSFTLASNKFIINDYRSIDHIVIVVQQMTKLRFHKNTAPCIGTYMYYV